MKRRLYFLLPDVQSSRIVHNELLLAKVEERRMHVVANDKIDLSDLPEADFRQKTDIVHGLQMGFIIGGLTGMILSAIAVYTGMLFPGLESWSVIALTLGGAFFGAFSSTMIAVNVSSTRLSKFKIDLDEGKILFMVDIPVQRVDEISELVHSHHPEADMRGIEPDIPAFP